MDTGSSHREGKIPIPGWAYIILGIAIIAYSKFIESKVPGQSLFLFVVIGGLFIAWGAYKEFVPRLRKNSVKKELVGPPVQKPVHYSTHLHPGGNLQHGVSHHASHQHIQPQQHPSHPYQPTHKQCPRCHSTTSNQSKFCHNCGFQFY